MRFAIGCVAVIGYCILYIASDFGGWPRLTYFQHERAWRFLVRADSPVPSNYLGTVLCGVGGGAAGGAAAAVVTRIRQAPIGQRWLNLWGAWALSAFFFGCAYFAWNV